MKILVILGHPDPKSFNHAIFERIIDTLKRGGHTITAHDLYREGFDPILTSVEIPDDAPLDDVIEGYCSDLHDADGIVIVHPNWWGQPPAVLKGWIDRVFRPGVAYRFVEGDAGDGVPVGLLKAKAALVINTSNTSDEREMKVFSDPLETLWRRCIFDLCGVKNFHRKMFNVVVTSSLEERKGWLDEVEEMVGRIFPPDDAVDV